MELSKNETKKNDERSKPSQIPPTPKTGGIFKSVSSKFDKTVSSLSKIPKRDIVNSSISRRGSAIATKPVSKLKAFNSKNSSKSLVNLNIAKPPRAPSLSSTKSNLISTQRSIKSKEATPRSQASSQSKDKTQKPIDRVSAKKNVLAFGHMKERLRSYQTEFMKKWEAVKDDLPQNEGEYKLVGVVQNDDGHLLAKNATKIKIKAVQKNLEDFKKELQNYAQNNLSLIIDPLDQLFKPSTGKIGDNPVKGLEYSNNFEEIKKKIKADHLNALGDVLKLVDSFEATDPALDSYFEAKVSNLMKEVEECRKNLDQSQKELTKIRKNEGDKEAYYKKELDEKDKKLISKQQDLEELKKKLENIKKDESKEKSLYRELQEKLNFKSKEVDELEKKLKSCFQTNAVQQTRNQEQELTIKKLEGDIKTALKEVDKRNRVESNLAEQSAKQSKEISNLKGDLVNMKKERENLEKEIQDLKKEAETHLEVNTQLISYKDKAKHDEVEIHNLRRTIKDLEIQLENLKTEANLTRDVHEELCKLQKIDAERSQKIELLEMELTKAHFQNQKLEEKIVMDRNLLKVRCSLIDSLQAKEKSQKIHLEDLFAEVGERNCDIQMLKTELLTKTEEFQNLFSTLGAKQLELTRQEHMIKLLQESNERAQTLRAKQEAKIGRLEEEVAQLKQTVAIYQDAVLPNNALKKNLLMAETSWENHDMNDNLGYYVDERRRKRHIDINVKKYEK